MILGDAVLPSTSLLKVSSIGGKHKRKESRERPVTFECLEVEGVPKSDAQEPELISRDESSSEDKQDTKMLNLPSSSGTTMSTSTSIAHEDDADSGETMPIFKSYNPNFISPEEQRHGRQQSMQEGLSPVRQLESMDTEDLVEGGSAQKEVTSPPTVAIPGSQCLPGKKKRFSLVHWTYRFDDSLLLHYSIEIPFNEVPANSLVPFSFNLYFRELMQILFSVEVLPP